MGIKNIIRRWLSEEYNQTVSCARESPSTQLGDDGRKLRLSVIKAEGGIVLEFSHYDPIKDRHYTKLHIVVDETEDIPVEIGKVISMEMMRL